ncbi:restriction endonuclease subunit S [Vibrio parahaemolyticus]
MSELPKGWVETEWANIVGLDGFRRGPFGGNLKKSCFVNEGYAVYEQYAPINDDCENFRYFISQDKFDELKGFQVNEDDFLISCSGTMGRITCVPKGAPIGVINQALLRIRLQDNYIDSNYFLRLFKSPSIQQQVLNKSVGGAIQNLAAVKELKEIRLPIAPLPEQKRIVAKLDEVLAQVDIIKARLDGIPELLKRFRQSVLASAVSGKLTEEWRDYKDYKKHDFSDDWKWGEIPSYWSVCFYPELVDSRLGKMLDKSKNTGKPTKYLGNINVRWFGTDLTNVQEILISDKEKSELALLKGDVLICEGGEPGRCCIWNKDSDEIIVFQKALHRARVGQNIIPEWLVYNLKNDADGLTLNQLFTGTTIKHLTGKALKRYPIRVPSIEEQKEIVRLVEQYFALADTIEAQVKKAQARVDNLTQSILAKAFRGELVPQNDDDEPAEVLLERIAKARKEAEALAKAAKKAGKKKA